MLALPFHADSASGALAVRAPAASKTATPPSAPSAEAIPTGGGAAANPRRSASEALSSAMTHPNLRGQGVSRTQSSPAGAATAILFSDPSRPPVGECLTPARVDLIDQRSVPNDRAAIHHRCRGGRRWGALAFSITWTGFNNMRLLHQHCYKVAFTALLPPHTPLPRPWSFCCSRTFAPGIISCLSRRRVRKSSLLSCTRWREMKGRMKGRPS